MAPQPDTSSLSPAGSSTYSSNTLTVGDGTWDSSRNTFLLPNLVGLNFETMQYNGMGNRFLGLEEYHQLILGHGVLAVMAFLFIIPLSVMTRRFRTGDPLWTDRRHIYLNILAMFMVTVVFILGVMAVGPARSLTNPHHGIGVAIFVLILIQVPGGSWMRGRIRGRIYRRSPVKKMLHMWIGRTIALLGVIQVPLGLTLYGSPKWCFVLYALWMTVLLVTYFILEHRRSGDYEYDRSGRSHHGQTVITEERKGGGVTRWLGPLAAGGLLAAWLNRRKDKRESSQSRPTEVISSRRGSRRGSESFVDEEKYTEVHERRGGGVMDKVLGLAGAVGAGALAKSYFDRRKERKEDERYSAVAPDTPSHRRHRPRTDSISDYTDEESRVDSRRGPILPGPGNPLDAATAISAATPRPVRPVTPVTPTPVGRVRVQRGDSISSTESPDSPSRRDRRASLRQRRPDHDNNDNDHTVRNSFLGAIGLGVLAKKWKDRKDRKDRQEGERVARIRDREEEEERRMGRRPGRYTGDGAGALGSDGRGGRRRRAEGDADADAGLEEEMAESEVSQSYVEPRRNGGTMPPLAAGAIPMPGGIGALPPPPPGWVAGSSGVAGPSGAGAAAASAAYDAQSQSRSRHDIVDPVPPPPPMDPRHYGTPPTSRGHGHEAEAALAGAALGAGAATLAGRHHSESRSRLDEQQSRYTNSPGVGPSTAVPPLQPQATKPSVASPPLALHVKMHGDRDRNVTVRRLREEEAAARERSARRGSRRRQPLRDQSSGGESQSDVFSEAPSRAAGSAEEVLSERRRGRYRRDNENVPPPPPPGAAPPSYSASATSEPLSPPRPAFAGGKAAVPPQGQRLGQGLGQGQGQGLKDSSYFSGAPMGSVSHHSVISPEGTMSGGPSTVGTGTTGRGEGRGEGRGDGLDPAERSRRRRAERQRAVGGRSVDYT